MSGGGYLGNNAMKFDKLATTWGRVGVLDATTNSRESAVSMVTELRPGHSGVRIPVGARDILFLRVQTNSVTHSALSLFPEVRNSVRNDENHLPSS